MTGDRNVEGALLEEVKRRIREISEEQHELARRQRILTHAATQLRLGRAVPIVLAEIRDQSPDLLLEPFDPEPTRAPAPLRLVRRVTGHSA